MVGISGLRKSCDPSAKCDPSAGYPSWVKKNLRKRSCRSSLCCCFSSFEGNTANSPNGSDREYIRCDLRSVSRGFRHDVILLEIIPCSKAVAPCWCDVHSWIRLPSLPSGIVSRKDRARIFYSFHPTKKWRRLVKLTISN